MDAVSNYSICISMVNITISEVPMSNHTFIGQSSNILRTMVDPELTCKQLPVDNHPKPSDVNIVSNDCN